ncbi:hypothetical protein PBRA_008086 [Plasmodiophora brassicae]|nr:hypothetical protein PBRA_008086 [Plasmodiophora brassicae]
MAAVVDGSESESNSSSMCSAGDWEHQQTASFDAPSDAGLTAVFGPLHGLDGVVANGARAAMTSTQARPMDTHDLSAVMVSPHVKFVHRYISFSCESAADASHVIDDMIRRLPNANHVRHVTLAEYGPDPEHGRRFMCLVVLHKDAADVAAWSDILHRSGRAYSISFAEVRPV